MCLYCRRGGVAVDGRGGDEPGVELGSTVEGDQAGRRDESVDGVACGGDSEESGDPPAVVAGCGVAAALDDDACGGVANPGDGDAFGGGSGDVQAAAGGAAEAAGAGAGDGSGDERAAAGGAAAATGAGGDGGTTSKEMLCGVGGPAVAGGEATPPFPSPPDGDVVHTTLFV